MEREATELRHLLVAAAGAWAFLVAALACPPMAQAWGTDCKEIGMEQISILLVDDEIEVLEVLCIRLERRGLKVYTANSGERALALLAERPVNIVLLDVKMPNMDGIAVLGRVRNEYPNVGVIMLSGHADMQVAAQGLEMGAFSYLLKPVDIESLLHKIEDACQSMRLEKASV